LNKGKDGDIGLMFKPDTSQLVMETKDGSTAFHAKTRTAWRRWLEKNHAKEKRVWLIQYHKESKVPSV